MPLRPPGVSTVLISFGCWNCRGSVSTGPGSSLTTFTGTRRAPRTQWHRTPKTYLLAQPLARQASSPRRTASSVAANALAAVVELPHDGDGSPYDNHARWLYLL